MTPVFKKCLLTIFTLALLPVSGCYYDNEELLYPKGLYGGSCDTTVFSFSKGVKPLIASNCLVCHNSSAASGNVILENYAQVKIYADNGKLLNALSYSGNIKMPPTGKLPDCGIRVVQKWIADKAPDN